MKPNFDISNRVVVVTGAAGVLCGTIAEALADCGATVALLDIALDKAESVAAGIRACGGQAAAFYADVTSRASLEAARAAIESAFGVPDALINGAGGNRANATASLSQPFFDIPTEALEGVFRLNVTGTILASQVFGAKMAELNSGVILNIASVSSFKPLTNVVGYAAAKAACLNFTQWLATYFNLSGAPHVRVNAIAPGFFITEQNRFLLIDQASGDPTPRGNAVLAKTPMNRFGSPEELCGAVVFLLSDSASFVNGEVVTIDGGFTAYTI